ncbi:MAG: secretin N-terminal domain-containing protein [Planctomycetota bacterium]
MNKPLATLFSLLALVWIPACQSTTATANSTDSEDAPFQVIFVEHVEASTLADTLIALADEAEQSGESALVVHVHDDSNSILLSGSDQRIAQAKDLIARLDLPANETDG